MNNRDRDNLEFLMNASTKVLEDWYYQMEEDDIAYAFELLELYQKELEFRELEILFLDRDVIIGSVTNIIH